MEKKKILLVAVSVGIFLVIAIGAAILIFSPRSGVPSNAIVMERSNQGGYPPPAAVENIPVYPRISDPVTDPQIPAPPDSAYQFPQSPSAAPGTPSSTAIQENNFYINGETQRQPYYTERTETRGSERTATPQVVITVPRPEGARIPALPEPAPAAAKPAAASRPAASPAKPAASPSAGGAARQPAKPASPAKTPAAASKPAAQSRPTYDAYWVQAGSFSTKVHADGVKETLASKGITSIIENRDLDGKTFYRVRIGPYTSQNEADYWLALIQTLDGFEESQVWKSQARHLN
ncbi:MAG: SPOR domain-containing protein [Treponema sp.]|nr:SPOR domain-containing protein [Treponema sp.]